MLRYIVRRVLQAIPILIAVSLLVFLMVHAVPGDPLNALVSPDRQSGVNLAALRHQYGLDKPLLQQYFFMMKGIFSGSLISFSERVPVFEMIRQTLPVTATIGLAALLISAVVGVILGILAAIRPFGVLDQSLSVLSVAGLSIPSFVCALILVYFFTGRLHLLPGSGFFASAAQQWSLGSILPHIVLPVLTLSVGLLPEFYRFTRSSVLEVMSEDFIRTARAKGLSQKAVLIDHGLRNGLLPIITMFGLNVSYVLGGSAVLETVFGIPGMGWLAVTAAMARDYPMIITTNLIAASLVILSNLLTDVLYAVADPRIKLERK